MRRTRARLAAGGWIWALLPLGLCRPAALPGDHGGIPAGPLGPPEARAFTAWARASMEAARRGEGYAETESLGAAGRQPGAVHLVLARGGIPLAEAFSDLRQPVVNNLKAATLAAVREVPGDALDGMTVLVTLVPWPAPPLGTEPGQDPLLFARRDALGLEALAGEHRGRTALLPPLAVLALRADPLQALVELASRLSPAPSGPDALPDERRAAEEERLLRLALDPAAFRLRTWPAVTFLSPGNGGEAVIYARHGPLVRPDGVTAAALEAALAQGAEWLRRVLPLRPGDPLPAVLGSREPALLLQAALALEAADRALSMDDWRLHAAALAQEAFAAAYREDPVEARHAFLSGPAGPDDALTALGLLALARLRPGPEEPAPEFRLLSRARGDRLATWLSERAGAPDGAPAPARAAEGETALRRAQAALRRLQSCLAWCEATGRRDLLAGLLVSFEAWSGQRSRAPLPPWLCPDWIGAHLRFYEAYQASGQARQILEAGLRLADPALRRPPASRQAMAVSEDAMGHFFLSRGSSGAPGISETAQAAEALAQGLWLARRAGDPQASRAMQEALGWGLRAVLQGQAKDLDETLFLDPPGPHSLGAFRANPASSRTGASDAAAAMLALAQALGRLDAEDYAAFAQLALERP